MGNLLLTRKAGESIKIGDYLMLTISEVHAKKVYVVKTVNGSSCAAWMRLGDSGDAMEGCRVTISAINHGRVRLAFEADKSIKIVRTELL